jgi:hypothetical protein
VACPPGVETHHRSGDILDNRRVNLQQVSASEHRLRTARRPGVSTWRGVQPLGARFYARLWFRCRSLSLGGYGSAILAAFARDDALVALAGPEVALNFPARIHPGHLRRRLAATHGKSFEVCFLKRADGTLRRMRARVPLPLEEAAHPPRPGDRANRLLCVVDVDANQYRSLPLERVLCVKLNDTWHRLDRRRRASTASAISSVPTAASTS